MADPYGKELEEDIFQNSKEFFPKMANTLGVNEFIDC